MPDLQINYVSWVAVGGQKVGVKASHIRVLHQEEQARDFGPEVGGIVMLQPCVLVVHDVHVMYALQCPDLAQDP